MPEQPSTAYKETTPVCPQDVRIIATVMILWGVLFTGIGVLAIVVRIYLLVLLFITGIALIAGGRQLFRLSLYACQQALWSIWAAVLLGDGMIFSIFMLFTSAFHDPEETAIWRLEWHIFIAWLSLNLAFSVVSTVYLCAREVRQLFSDGK